MKTARNVFFLLGYFLVAGLMIGGGLELAARMLGIHNPVLYYTSTNGGMRPLPGQKIYRSNKTITVDKNGFRTPVSDSPSAMHILFLGDSVTWGGTYLDDREIFSEIAADVVRQSGTPVYAMNSGVNGTGLLNHAEIFFNETQRVDMVVWIFPWGDMERGYVIPNGLWPNTHKPVFALSLVLDQLILRYWIRSPLRNGFYPETALTEFQQNVLHQNRKRIIDRNTQAFHSVVAKARERGIPVICGIVPRRDSPLEPDARQFLSEVRGVRILNIESIRPSYYDHVHFNKEGHYLVGEALGALILDILSDKK